MNWSKRPVHWEDDDHHYFSFVFTWDLWDWARGSQPELDGKQTVIGGPAVRLHPEWAPDWVTIGPDQPALYRHNPLATRTSMGCIRRCPFCAVPKTEGDLLELVKWPVRPIVIDNNLLACSQSHFDEVIDKLKHLDWCDFNQGLDARLLTNYHALRLAELQDPKIRLAFDAINYEQSFMDAFNRLRKAGIPKRSIHVYVLIGFDDSPEDALYRLRLVRSLGIKPNPMRYQQLDARRRNDCVAPGWTHEELMRYMSYWSNLRYTAAVPFKEYVHHGRRIDESQISY